jgi:hypothetical protein
MGKKTIPLDVRVKQSLKIAGNRTLLVLNEIDGFMTDAASADLPWEVYLAFHRDNFTQQMQAEKKIYAKLAESYQAMGMRAQADACIKRSRYCGWLSHMYV